MVVSSAPQLASTFRLWHRFVMPIEGGQRDAVAVPDYVADQLSSAYTLMVTSMVVNVWCICFAMGFFYIMRHNTDLAPLSSNLWNKRASMSDSLMSMLSKEVAHWKRWWVYPAIVIILGCWVAQTALSIVIPPLIFIDNAAPVNINAIIVPPNLGNASSDTAQLFSLDVPAALRAVGGALVAASDVASRVTVTQRDIGTRADFQPLQEIDYAYAVSGHELGLQHYSTLRLSVTGSCRTEYGWLTSSTNRSGYTNDTYAVFGNATRYGNISLSLYDGPSPVAYFYTSDAPYDGAGLGNTTYAVFVSSVDRVSYTQGTDAIYYTGASEDTASEKLLGGTTYIVQPGRPALSCWQADVWSYGGANSTVTGLNSTALPGLDLPLALQLIFARYLGAPRIESIGTLLGAAALQSSTTALGTIFDAGSSSVFADLHRLALAAYIASANTLTDTTLSSTYLGSKTAAGNLIYSDDTNKPMAGADAFVVWSSDVSTISVRAAIVIPVVAVASWLLVIATLKFTPLASVNALDILELQKNIYEKYPEADIAMLDARTWHTPVRVPRVPLVGNLWKAAGSRKGSNSSGGGYQPPAQPIYADAPGSPDAASQAPALQPSPAAVAAAAPPAPYQPPVQPVYSTAVDPERDAGSTLREKSPRTSRPATDSSEDLKDLK